MIWYAMVCYGMLWYAMVCYGMVWYGMLWYAMVCYAMVWYGMVWYAMVWYGMVWYAMVWYAMVCYGMVCYGMLWTQPDEKHPGAASRPPGNQASKHIQNKLAWGGSILAERGFASAGGHIQNKPVFRKHIQNKPVVFKTQMKHIQIKPVSKWHIFKISRFLGNIFKISRSGDISRIRPNISKISAGPLLTSRSGV